MSAQHLTHDLERWCGQRWRVMPEPHNGLYVGYPLYDAAVLLVEAETVRRLWRRILDVDPKLREKAAAAVAALGQLSTSSPSTTGSCTAVDGEIHLPAARPVGA
ncbi:hypothetical protein, partial [Nonomuraea sp. NPDC059022]|uniref:hypothetical protein n=1 Tax=Nonomuraea sp. NPDC059022 TaxID=3346705 RepID=UPI0036819932